MDDDVPVSPGFPRAGRLKVSGPGSYPGAEVTMMIVQVCHANCDTFHEIEEGRLREIHGLPPKERKAAFMEASSKKSVHSTAEVDVILVMDGVNDEESWEELAEETGWES